MDGRVGGQLCLGDRGAVGDVGYSWESSLVVGWTGRSMCGWTGGWMLFAPAFFLIYENVLLVGVGGWADRSKGGWVGRWVLFAPTFF